MSKLPLAGILLLLAPYALLADEVGDDETVIDTPAPPPRTAPAPAPAARAPAPAAPAAARPAAVLAVAPRALRPWYIAPMAAYAFPTCDGCVEHGAGWQLAVGKVVNDHWSVELSAVDRDLDLKGIQGSTDELSYGVNALWFPDRKMRFAPFLLAGAGAHEQDMDPDKSSTSPYGTVGAGMLLTPSGWNPSVRAGGQWIRPFGDDYCGKGDTVVGLGLQFHFGG